MLSETRRALYKPLLIGETFKKKLENLYGKDTITKMISNHEIFVVPELKLGGNNVTKVF